ncbi:MAG TPA: TadE family protein [Candidatus Limnocylindrales bacterium]
MVEFALVAPIFMLALLSVVVLGLFVFYQAEITNAARVAARYAAIHSSTAQCPTTSWLTPQAPPLSYYACDPPSTWPGMKTAGQSSVWGLNPAAVTISACWSGYRDPSVPGSYDYPAIDPSTGTAYMYAPCTMAGQNPVTAQDAIACPAPATVSGDDTASDQAGSNVTVYACYPWVPPMAGFVLIPSTITIRAVVTEVVQRQQ